MSGTSTGTTRWHYCLRHLDDHNATITLQDRDIIDDGVSSLVRTIQSNRTIKRGFVAECFLAHLDTPDLYRVWKALVHLPHLESLKCSGLRDRSFCALVSGIQCCPDPPPLTRLWMVGICLTASTRDMSLELMVQTLANIPTLQTVNLLLVARAGTKVESSVNMEFRTSQDDDILWEIGAYDHCIFVLLWNSFQSNLDRWTNLKVSGVDVSGDAARAVADIMSISEPMALDKVELVLDAMPVDGARHLAAALASNHTLKELSLQLGGRDLQSISHSSLIMEPIVDMLETNTGLEWLQISRNLFHDETAIALARCLRRNRTLKVLELSFDSAAGQGSISEKGYNELWAMLQVNQVIELLPCDGLQQDSVLKSKIELCLKLNERGLRPVQLSINTHYDEFLELLEANGEDLNCVFYLLSKNPQLFTIASQNSLRAKRIM
jgi:hypothetical protein